ncbi:MAG: sulfatase-like hydrolase/transferase [Fimbriiglobus sp.]
MRGIVLVLAWGLAAQCFAAERVNFVVVLLDDAGQRDFGCYGSKYHKTPNLDAFAKTAAQFQDATTPCPVCSPTRVGVITGRYPQRYGVTDWLPGRGDLPAQALARPKQPTGLAKDAKTVAEWLKPAGYVTGYIGKWHMGGDGESPKDQGFDVSIGASHIGSPPTYFAPYENKKTNIPGLEKAEKGEYLTDRLTTEAIRFLETNRDKPFFLQLAHYAPHTPLQAKPEVIAKYTARPAGQQGNPTYAAMIESIDDNMGRLFKALDDLKLTENTVVIFTSDNGGLATTEGGPTGATYNGPYREGKGFLYEGGVRVPFLVRGPKVKAGQSNASVNSLDIVPTILGYAGVVAEGLDGQDLREVLAGGTQKTRELYWHYPHYANQGSTPGSAVRVGNMKLIEFALAGRQELFDLSKDLSESRNLASEKPEVVKELSAKLAAWKKGVGAQEMTPNAVYLPNPQNKDGHITLHARTAQVYGTQFRFEPLPHKNTLGYWVKQDDYAEWEFTVTTPGEFTVEVLQGCGKGSGGAEVQLSVGESKAKFTVKDTGGFQAFERREVGTLTIPIAGRHKLTVRALTKPGVAVMDLRELVLKKK